MDLPVREMRFQVRSLHYKFGVALMARTLTDQRPWRRPDEGNNGRPLR